jgi:FkbM family methyltransferase
VLQFVLLIHCGDCNVNNQYKEVAIRFLRSKVRSWAINIRAMTLYRIKRLLKDFLIAKIPPYKYVEEYTLRSIHKFLDINPDSISSWCIVGGKLGSEVPIILQNYKNCKISVFECSERYSTRLTALFLHNQSVEIIDKAVTDVIGKRNFFETSLEGSGSVLPLGSLHKNLFYSLPAEEFWVETTTLDFHFKDRRIDVLWIDVQGAELLVLKGASETLTKCKAVFIEVSERPELYEGGATKVQLDLYLRDFGFAEVLLGTDFNMTGNALYVRNSKHHTHQFVGFFE